MEITSPSQITEYILTILSDLQPVLFLLMGLWIGLSIINLIMHASSSYIQQQCQKPGDVVRIPSWVVEENKHRTRTLEYQLRIHHHRARVSKRTSRKS